MAVLVTGAAGFIGYHVSEALIARGEQVVGVDDLNAYYSPALKQARLARLQRHAGFRFHRLDIADKQAFDAALAGAGVDRIVHLAAQAGVRWSLEHPFDYVRSNIQGQLVVLEWARHAPGFRHLVYASSSSVYGANIKLPFSVDDRVDHPVSLYAATKRADELMGHAYAHLYRIPMTGLRFFTVYGPWGRPDMALWLFAEAILAGRPIRVFNNGDMARDFTYVDDIVKGILATLDRPPAPAEGAPQAIYNIGNHRSEPLPKLISILEEALGRKATIAYEPMQPGDVKETYADVEALSRNTGFAPSTPIEVGVPRFVEWYRDFHKV
jgi:UDP-glucuronate 4-epimerase